MTDGVVLVDKETGCTSHDVVARCRRVFGQRRVGHAGTLDPGASGLLLVGLGRATRLLGYSASLAKHYVGEVVLGVATSTLDDLGEVTGTWDMGQVDRQDVRAAAASLTGPILQVPPMVSALKVGGRRLHQLARAGVEVDRPARPVTVHHLELHPTASPNVWAMDVSCSSGTYVRSLAADLGQALGGGAHLRSLRRLAIGPFSVDDALPADQLGEDRVLPSLQAVAHLDSVTVPAGLAGPVGHGAVLRAADLGLPEAGTEGPWAVLDPSGQLLAVYRRVDGQAALIKPEVVVGPADGGQPAVRDQPDGGGPPPARSGPSWRPGER